MSFLNNISSCLILKNILNILDERKLLKLIKVNKILMNKMDIDIEDYKNFSGLYSTIEIEIIPVKDYKGTVFITSNDYKDFIEIEKNKNNIILKIL